LALVVTAGGARTAVAQATTPGAPASDSAGATKANAQAGITSGAAKADTGAGQTPAAAPGGRLMTIQGTAAVGGSIAIDSVPALSPAKSADSAARSSTVAKTPEQLRQDSVTAVQQLALMYPSTVTVPLDRVAAIVGDEPILWSQVVERINVERAQGLTVPSDSAGQMLVARNVVNELINEELLVLKGKELKVEVTDDDVAPATDEQIKRVRANFASDQEFRAALKKAGFGNVEEYRKTLIDQNKRSELERKVIQKIKEDGKLIPVGVSEKDINDAFNTTKDKLPKRPATVTFRQIVITPKPTPEAKAAAKAKADSILAELKKNGYDAEQFAQLAKRETMDQTTKEQGGDLGWNRRGNMVPEFDRWMFALAPGQLSPVIETVFGFHIIRVDRRKPAEVDASHILIRWKIDTGDVVTAHSLADSVLTLWKGGANFDTLVVRYHDSNEEKGSLQPFPRDSLPPSYSSAFAGKVAGDFVTPFPIVDRGTGHPKFVVAQILTAEGGGDYTVSDWRDKIRDQLADERAIARLFDTLRKQTYVQVRI
jgi:peptidyl-prolyl cis-trans isomerase SurA